MKTITFVDAINAHIYDTKAISDLLYAAGSNAEFLEPHTITNVGHLLSIRLGEMKNLVDQYWTKQNNSTTTQPEEI